MRFFAYTKSTHVASKRQSQSCVQVIFLVFITAVFFFGHLQIATAQTVHIPDPSLRAVIETALGKGVGEDITCLLYTSPSPRDGLLSRMPSSA